MPRPLPPPHLPALTDFEGRVREMLGRHARPPGLATLAMPANFLAILGHQLDFIEHVEGCYGATAYFQLGRLKFFSIHEPELIGQVLLSKQDSFIKDIFSRELEEILGKGLLTSQGETWRRHRKLAAPKLKRAQIASYAETMKEASRVASEALVHGRPTDVWQAMSDLTLHIVVETLLGLAHDHDATTIISASLELAMHHYAAQQNSLWHFVPRQVPSPTRRAFERAVVTLDEITRRMIRERAERPPGDDLLWRLLEARDDEGEPMTEAQLRDEAITMLLAGHETTALATTYVFDALARHPRVRARMHEEIDALDGTPPHELMQRAPYTLAVIKETMRLYPPAWIISREATKEVALTHGEEAWTMPAGSLAIISPYVLHRRAELFEDPLSFEPERWLDEAVRRALPRYAYLPFGGGARICIGNHFAMMELLIAVTELAKRWRFELIDDAPLTFKPFITLRPDGPVWMRPLRRGSR